MIAFVVDHELNADSGRWTRFAVEVAERAGARPVRLRWGGEKPTSGLPEAARRARHALIADAARACGVAVVAFAHTRDDAAEGETMRSEGAPLGRLREWAPSPAWPEGRGVFLLRPLLGVGREALRTRLRALGATWLEDPANDDQRYARARARRALDGVHEAADGATEPCENLQKSAQKVRSRFGSFVLPPEPGLLARAAVCAGGGSEGISTARAEAVLARLTAGAAVQTLGGARVTGQGTDLAVSREVGEFERWPPRTAGSDGGLVWDGRFHLDPAPAGEIIPLRGATSRLSEFARRGLRDVPAAARAALPVVRTSDGRVLAPLLEDTPWRCVDLTGARLRAATGLIANEATLRRARALMACSQDGPYLAR